MDASITIPTYSSRYDASLFKLKASPTYPFTWAKYRLLGNYGVQLPTVISSIVRDKIPCKVEIMERNLSLFHGFENSPICRSCLDWWVCARVWMVGCVRARVWIG